MCNNKVKVYISDDKKDVASIPIKQSAKQATLQLLYFLLILVETRSIEGKPKIRYKIYFEM